MDEIGALTVCVNRHRPRALRTNRVIDGRFVALIERGARERAGGRTELGGRCRRSDADDRAKLDEADAEFCRAREAMRVQPRCFARDSRDSPVMNLTSKSSRTPAGD